MIRSVNQKFIQHSEFFLNDCTNNEHSALTKEQLSARVRLANQNQGKSDKIDRKIFF